jgi:hypothetical protein
MEKMEGVEKKKLVRVPRWGSLWQKSSPVDNLAINNGRCHFKTGPRRWGWRA